MALRKDEVDGIAQDRIQQLRKRPASKRREPSVVHTVRWPASLYREMTEHFESVHMDLSAGIRMAVAKYLRDESKR